MWMILIQSFEGLNRAKRLTSLLWLSGNSSCMIAWAGTLVFSCFWTGIEIFALPGPWAWQLLDWNLYHWLSWFSALWTQTGTIPLILLGLQLADCRSWDFSASVIVEPISCHLFLSVYPFDSDSLGELLILMVIKVFFSFDLLVNLC